MDATIHHRLLGLVTSDTASQGGIWSILCTGFGRIVVIRNRPKPFLEFAVQQINISAPTMHRLLQVIIYVVLCLFAFTVYATNVTLGSPARVSV